MGKPPKEIAALIIDALKSDADVERVEMAGPGYVNIWLTPKALLQGLTLVRGALQPKAKRNEAPIIIDYSQPNIAKPLGVHHIMSTIIGQSLGNLYEHEGVPVVRWNYIGDWGTQFGKLAVAFEKWGKGKKASQCTLDDLLSLYVQFHTEAEKDATLEAQGQEAFLRLEKGDKELRAFWQDVVSVTKQSLGSIYDRLNVCFDLDTGESYYEDKMEPVIEEGKRKGVFTVGQKGALIASFAESTGMPPAIVLKADGATIYMTRDLAMVRDRIDRFHPESVLYVVDIAQKLHFEQVFAIVAQLGWELPRLEHVYFGRMKFTDRSMSTRKGNILKLEHVLDEAVERAAAVIAERGESIQADDPKDLAEMMGVGALVYGILSQNRKMDLVFDWDKMLSFEGNSAPYLMYTHARARSVLRKAGEEPSLPENPPMEEGERVLVRSLLKFPSVLEEARKDYLPHKLANYLYALCQEMNGFYNSFPILQSEGAARHLRLSITALTADVLRTGASLLTLRLPDAM